MMFRRSLFIAAALLLASQLGCRSRCGSSQPPAFFSSNAKSAAPYQMVGRSDGYGDLVPGQPVPYQPGLPSSLIPGGTYPPPGPLVPGARPDELHVPAPSDMIRPPAIPYPAPGDAMLPLPSTPGTPVKGLNR